MVDYVWFSIAGFVPTMPRPYYLGRGRVFHPGYDSRSNPQQPMKDHCVIKISLSDGGLCGVRDQQPVRLRPGHVVLREFGQRDVWDCFDPKHLGEWEFLGLIFTGEAGLSIFRAITQKYGNILQLDLNGMLVSRMMALTREPTHTVAVTASDGMQLVCDLLCALAASAESQSADDDRNVLAQAVRQTMASRPGRNLSVDELAQAHGVSREHLTRVFTREFGISPHRYAMQMKIREACQRLRHTTQPVKTIMHELGFESRTTFLRMFRRVTGMTPAEFRGGTRRIL